MINNININVLEKELLSINNPITPFSFVDYIIGVYDGLFSLKRLIFNLSSDWSRKIL